MPETIIFFVVLGAAVILFGPRTIKFIINKLVAQKARTIRIAEDDPLLESLATDKPAIVYFRAPWCKTCELRQESVIEQLEASLNDAIQILRVNVDEQVGAAQRWGVMGVPQTFVLDKGHRIQTSNLGFASLGTLKRQCEEAASEG